MDNFVDNLVYTLGKGRGKHGEMCSFMWKRQLLLNIYPQFYPDFPVSVKLFTFLYVFINSIDLRATPPFILTLSVMTQTRQGETLLPAGLPLFIPLFTDGILYLYHRVVRGAVSRCFHGPKDGGVGTQPWACSGRNSVF